MYRPFHKTLPRSSVFVNWISVRFYEMDCIIDVFVFIYRSVFIFYIHVFIIDVCVFIYRSVFLLCIYLCIFMYISIYIYIILIDVFVFIYRSVYLLFIYFHVYIYLHIWSRSRLKKKQEPEPLGNKVRSRNQSRSR